MKYSITLLILLSVVSTENAATFALRTALQGFSKTLAGKTTITGVQAFGAWFTMDAVFGGLWGRKGPKVTNAQNFAPTTSTNTPPAGQTVSAPAAAPAPAPAPQTLTPPAPTAPAATAPTVPTTPSIPAANVTPSAPAPTVPTPPAPAPQAPTPAEAPKSNSSVITKLAKGTAAVTYKAAEKAYEAGKYITTKAIDLVTYVASKITLPDAVASALGGAICYHIPQDPATRSIIKHGVAPTAGLMALAILARESTEMQILLGAAGGLCTLIGYSTIKNQSTDAHTTTTTRKSFRERAKDLRKTFTENPLASVAAATVGAATTGILTNITFGKGFVAAGLMAGAYYITNGFPSTDPVTSRATSFYEWTSSKVTNACSTTKEFLITHKGKLALGAAGIVSLYFISQGSTSAA